jgi:hypothetical protein
MAAESTPFDGVAATPDSSAGIVAGIIAGNKAGALGI